MKTDHTFDLPPPAMMSLTDNTVTVCAWCPTKDQADQWAKNRGYSVSHGICPICMAAQMPQMPQTPNSDALAASLVKEVEQITQNMLEGCKALRKMRAEVLGMTLEQLDEQEAHESHQRQLAETYEGIPEQRLTEQDIDAMAPIYDRTESSRLRPHIQLP